MDSTVLTQLLVQAGTLSSDLASALRGLGHLRAARIDGYAESYRASEGLGVTERRERAVVACAQWDVEIARTQGEVDALRVELAYVELQLRDAPRD